MDSASSASSGAFEGVHPDFGPPTRRIDRYRLPGWSDLAEIAYLAKHVSKGRRRPGRPRGPYLIQARGEIEDVYRGLWEKAGHRPTWAAVARAMNVEERTLLRARRDFGLEAREIEPPTE